MGRVLDQEDGLGVYSYNLLKNMIQQDQESIYIILLRSSNNTSLFSEFENVKTQVIPAKIKHVWDQFYVSIAAKKHHSNIIFNPKFSLPILSRIPGVFVLQGSDWYVNPGNYKWWDNIYIRLMMPIYCRKASRLLSISKCVVDDLVKFAKIKAEKVTVTYAAPSPHFQLIEDEARLKEFSLKYNLPERFILTVARAYHTGHGRLPKYPGGNIENLIRGYKRYKAAGGNLPLVIAGKEIDTYLHGEGFHEEDLHDIVFTGFVPHKDIVFLYNLADFFVLATLYESFAFPLVEAMASGCPAIVPTTGACPEVAGGAALLVDPLDVVAIGQAMTDLDNSNELREKFRIAGIQRAKVFTWQKTAEQTLDVLDTIFPRSKKEAAE